MGDGRYGAISIKVMAVSADDRVVGESWVQLPDDVDAYTAESAIRQSFGEPIEPALDRHPVHGVLQVGWYFPGDRLTALDLPAAGNQALVIPFITRTDGSRAGLFVFVADERATFEDAVGGPVTSVDGRRECRPSDT
jgi:hypothetical protein